MAVTPFDWDEDEREERIDYLVGQLELAEERGTSAWIDDEYEDENDEDDLGDCPYFARYCGDPGHDPHAGCYQMGICEAAGEPQCVTCEPSEGWPSRRRGEPS